MCSRRRAPLFAWRTQTTRSRPTGSWGYLRLRRSGYDAEKLRTWVQRIRSQPWESAYVFFKHEDEGKGPQFAAQFNEALQS